MPKVAAPLTPLQVKRLVDPGLYAVGTVNGLYLKVSTPISRSWVLRLQIGKRRRDLGLGSYPGVELAAAWGAAREARKLVAAGADPLEVKRAARSRLLADQQSGKTFKECAADYIADMEPTWGNVKHGKQWKSTLETYAEPVIGKMLVRDIETAHVMAVLRPMWKTVPETGTRVRQRIEAVLNWATVREYRTGANPARWHGHLDKLLPHKEKVAPTKNRPHLPAAQMYGFMNALKKESGNGARALEFLVLTGVRVGNARMAAWSEFNLDSKVWTIPGSAREGGTGNRTKTGVEFEVPLSDAAIEVLKSLPRIAGSDIVFPSPTGKVMCDAVMSALMKRMGIKPADAVPHGFRSTFKTWAAERTRHTQPVIEAALQHQIKNKVEAAYMRGNWLDKRRPLMQDWANFLEKAQDHNVVPLKTRNA